MKDKKIRRLREGAKDLLIVVLALLAIYLAFRAQLVNFDFTNVSGGWLGSVIQLLGGRTEQILSPPETQEPRTVPVYPARIVVTSSNLSRNGVQYNNAAADELFSGVFSVLGEALSTAGSPGAATEAQWQNALSQRPGIYFDFLGAYPLETLLAWLEEDGSNLALTGTARRLLLADNGEGEAVLYYQEASNGRFYACTTSSAVDSHLLTAVEGWGSNSLEYAFEYGDAQGFENLDPYVLLDAQPPQPRVYQVYNALGTITDQTQLRALLASMEALRFQSQTGTPYQPNDREWVVNDDQGQLRIGSDGTIRFRTDSMEDPCYPVNQAGEEPTATELLDAVQPIAAGTIGAWCGEARLYLISLEHLPDGSWQVDFGYTLNGAPVYVMGEEQCARFLIRSGAVTEYTMCLRTYTATGETTSILPERQAAAALAALDAQGRELTLCYEDNGGDTVRAGWIAR